MSTPDGLLRFPVVVGPTAGGKTGLAIEVALEFQSRGMDAGEVISADAYQIYRGMDIGTGKVTTHEARGVPHHLIDCFEPDQAGFTLATWLGSAEELIGDIRDRGRTPIVVGGTHLYIKSLLEGLFEGPRGDETLRIALRAMDARARRNELERVDPAAAARIHPNDERRTVRALEVFRLTGVPISEHQAQWDRDGQVRTDAVLVGLDWPTDAINGRINARVKAMVESGLVEEARALWDAGRLGPQAREALGYKQLAAHFEGRGTLQEAIEAVKIETRRLAKNQRTWLRRLRATPGSVWIDAQSTPQAEWANIVVNSCSTTI